MVHFLRKTQWWWVPSPLTLLPLLSEWQPIAFHVNYNRNTTKYWSKIHLRAFPQVLYLSPGVECYKGETKDKLGFCLFVCFTGSTKSMAATLSELSTSSASLGFACLCFLTALLTAACFLWSSFTLSNFFPKSYFLQLSLYSLPWAAYPSSGPLLYKGHLRGKENSLRATKQYSICLKFSSCLEVIPWKWSLV